MKKPYTAAVALGLLAAGLFLPACASTIQPPPAAAERGWPAYAAPRASQPLEVIAIGSCANEEREAPIWGDLVAAEPDVFLFIGDNVYADVPDIPETAEDIREAYDLLASSPGYLALIEHTPVLATWDDHDFGLNDAGAEWFLKEEAQQIFLDFYAVAEDDPRRGREGVYSAHTFGPEGRRTQVILVDTRYHRSPITRKPEGRDDLPGRYVPNDYGRGQLLGEAQWDWLREQLLQPADLRIIASSIQVVAHEHGWECWGNFPHERDRLYRLIDETRAEGVVFVSGDRHLTELSRDTIFPAPYPMWDFTSSGFNWGESEVPDANQYRVTPVHRTPTFGLIRVDWDAPDPTITFDARTLGGEVLFRHAIGLSSLTFEENE